MKRIDSVNARADVNGVGKKGFHDNADLPGQDATYLTPGWLNTVQEELANAIEGFGQTLDSTKNNQLFTELSNLFAGLNAAISQVRDNLNGLEQDLSNVQDYAIGDLYITTRNFANSTAVAAHHGYGTWALYGDGQTLITLAQSGNTSAESWMFGIGNAGGSNKKTLAVDNLPAHDHTLETSYGGSGGLPAGATRLGDYNGHANDDEIDSWIRQTTSQTGSGEALSVVQSGIVIAVWQRVS
ncbi:phage baseplate protein [Acinetobacter sp.]|uniref:phage baseplate protein n=1 Tax=Acinetobacter sp. TaxID=472 RepID=UPI003CFBEB36